MFDMRYHIASLVAVFLALAIGIMLGTVIDDKGVLAEQQQALVKRIESGFDDLRTQNKTLSEEVTEQRKFATEIIPLTVTGRLTDGNVAIITTTKTKGAVLTELANTIGKAGATVSRIELTQDFKITDQTITQIKPYFATDITVDNAHDLIVKKMIDELTENAVDVPTVPSTTSTTNKIPFLAQLKTIGFIKTDLNVNGPVKPVTAALVLGGSDAAKDPLKVDLPIILQLKAMNVRTVGVEAADCKNSYIKAYQGAGIPTVDNVDQPTGIVSAIFALAGTDGNFGVKETAVELMPTP